MSGLTDLLASYQDLRSHEVPDDAAWLAAREAALRSIANAIEDDDAVESLDDEIDRTLLLNAVRIDALLVGGLIARHGAASEVIGELAVNRLMGMMVPEPMGVRPALRLLELRRRGVEQALLAAAERLGFDGDWQEAARVIDGETEENPPDDGMQMAASLLDAAGIRVIGAASGEPGRGISVSEGLRAIAGSMYDSARRIEPRPVRAGVEGPGAREGWQRTVAALVHRHAGPGEGFSIARAAIVDAVAAEADLRFHGGEEEWESLAGWIGSAAGLGEAAVEELRERIIRAPLAATAAALSHEGWQGWHAEEGTPPGEFIGLVLPVCWLPIPLAKWATEIR